MIYRVYSIPIKIPITFFSQKSEKKILKYEWSGKMTNDNSRSNLKKNEARGIALSYFKLYFKPIVIKLNSMALA